MIFIFFLMSFASDLPGEELFVAEPAKVETTLPDPTSTVTSKAKPASQKLNESTDRNLPSYFESNTLRESPVSELVTKPPGSFDFYNGLKVGDSLSAGVSHSIIAFRDEKAPVIAIIDHGTFRGLRFIGYSMLEPNSRRIFVTFDRIVANGQIFKVSAVGVSAAGQPGLLGKYYSREEEYFVGDFVSSFVAGYFDGLVPRRTNAFGQLEVDNSVDSAVKKGLASGALSSAERFRDKLKKVPEFSEIKGPLNLTIMILDQAKRE